MTKEKFTEILNAHSGRDMGCRYMNGDDESFIYEKLCQLSCPDAQKETYTQNDIDTEPPHKTKGKFISVEDHQKEIEALKKDLSETSTLYQASANTILRRDREIEELREEIQTLTFEISRQQDLISELQSALTSKESDVKKAVEAFYKFAKHSKWCGLNINESSTCDCGLEEIASSLKSESNQSKS